MTIVCTSEEAKALPLNVEATIVITDKFNYRQNQQWKELLKGQKQNGS